MTERKMKEVAHAMNMQAIVFRGQIINAFTVLEGMIDGILLKTLSNEPDYSRDMNMGTRKKLFNKFIQQYESEKGIELNGLMDKINNCIDKRNHLAHWVFDTTPQGIEAFVKSKVMKFVWTYNDEILGEEILTIKAAKAIENRIIAAGNQVNIIYREICGPR